MGYNLVLKMLWYFALLVIAFAAGPSYRYSSLASIRIISQRPIDSPRTSKGPFFLSRCVSSTLKRLDAIVEEGRLRANSFTMYRDKMQSRLDAYFEEFKKSQVAKVQSARTRMEHRLENINEVYDKALDMLRMQREAIDELNRLKVPKVKTYNSLDEFRREFNESFSSLSIKFAPQSTKVKPKKVFEEPTRVTESMQEISLRLQKQWDEIRRTINTLPRTNDMRYRSLMGDLSLIQEETNMKAKRFMDESKAVLAKTYSKRDVKRERDALGLEYERLARDVTSWIETRSKPFEARLRILQENMVKTTQIYEELLSKRQSGVYYNSLVDLQLNKALNLLDPSDPGKVNDHTHMYIRSLTHSLTHSLIHSHSHSHVHIYYPSISKTGN